MIKNVIKTSSLAIVLGLSTSASAAVGSPSVTESFALPVGTMAMTKTDITTSSLPAFDRNVYSEETIDIVGRPSQLKRTRSIKIEKLLEDAALLNAVSNDDVAKIKSDPRILRLVNSPEFKAMLDQLD